MAKKWIIIGSGGHAAVVSELIEMLNGTIHGYISPKLSTHPKFEAIHHLGNDELRFDPQFNITNYWFAMGVGSTGNTGLRQQIYQSYLEVGASFPALVHPNAYVSKTAHISNGTVVFPGTIIQSNAQIGSNVIVNSGAIIEHDCMIGANSHIAPGAIICGGVKISENVHVGARAVIREGIQIGTSVLVGMGAVVIHSINSNQTVVGCPARPI